jgi:crossover junction endodeoxyribonuclease RusA
MKDIIVIGEPVTAGSLKSYGGGKVTHASGRTLKWEEWIAWAWVQKYGNRGIPLTGAVMIDATFYFVRPDGHTGKRGLTKEGRKYPYPSHKRKRDLDKLLRALLDALTGLAYEDDGQVVLIKASKVWGNELIRAGCTVIVDEYPCEVAE